MRGTSVERDTVESCDCGLEPLTPDAINTTQGTAAVKVEFTATDNLSGVKYVEVVFASPTGAVLQRGSAMFEPAKEVRGSVEVTFPQSSDPGVWKVASFMVTDAAGNSLLLKEDAMAPRLVRVR